MPAQIQTMPSLLGPAYIRKAQVIRAMPGHVYRVRLEGQGEITARTAMPLTGPLEPGNEVLVAGENPTSGYIIGVPQTDQANRLRTSQGAGAKVRGRGDDQSIAVHDDRERIVFEYFPATGKAVVCAPEGDLQLAAPNGRIDLQSGEGIRCQSQGDVTLRSDRTVQIAAEGRNGHPDQTMRMNGDGVALGVHRMDLIAGRGDVRIAQAAYKGKLLKSNIDRAKLVYGKLETTARRIWQTSGYLLRKVGHLYQTQAGRKRTLVKGAHHTQSQRTTLIAKEDVRIDGQKINLG